jgi:cobyrinic acid a,c-diamide synthase
LIFSSITGVKLALPFQIPRLVIAGTGSGVGKTTVTLGLIQAFRNQGLRVASFKCGPDYLDPTYHSRASGQTCQNLDSWMMGKEALLSTFQRASENADLAIVEGVMGLFDGLTPTAETGSTAEIAKLLKAPVLLVIDASGMARTIAAIAKGFRDFDPELKLAGVVANWIGSRGHLKLLHTAMSATFGDQVPLLGGLIKSPELAFPERHLGLLTADEQNVPDSLLQAWGGACQEYLNMNQALKLAQSAPEILMTATASLEAPNAPRRTCRIGIAHDEAFHFYYEYNLRSLQSSGAELIFFSPLQDEKLPDVDGLYLGGGYPELFATQLSQNLSIRNSIRDFAFQNKPVYAECGGLMYLSEKIVNVEGESFPMVGLIPGTATMGKKLKAMGYVEIETEQDTLLGPHGLRFRGHQFRYSDLSVNSDLPVEYAYRVRRRRDQETFSEGYARNRVLGTYVHAHWASNPLIPQNFVKACLCH